MKLLILGGTVFVGRHIVHVALERGHEVTLFNRGLHNTDLFPMAEKLRGDRESDLEALRGRQWDAVIDTCGYLPWVVRASAELLADAVGHYTFISSLAVYMDLWLPGLDESAPVHTLVEEATGELTRETYGPLKVLCERAVEAVLPDRVLIIRPGLVAGPHDPTDRFTYWPSRVARGGEVLAPGRPDRQIQIIDVRDLAQWTVHMVEAGKTGAYNAIGPDYVLTMQRLLEECKAVSGSGATFIWASEEFLLKEGAVPFTEVPLWIPGKDDAVNCRKAIGAGLIFRPLADTIRDTLAWNAARPANVERLRGLKPHREIALLTAWKAAQGASGQNWRGEVDSQAGPSWIRRDSH